MKKLFFATKLFFLICVVFLTGCSKSVESTVKTPVSAVTPGDIASDPAFTGLYDALNHFDPRYLQLVYNDQRSTAEINLSAANLIQKIQTDTTNLEWQQELAETYRFKNIEELKYFSKQVAINADIIKTKYYANATRISNEDVNVFMKARAIYAKNRMDSVKNIEKIKPSSMYDDYILNPEPPAFIFFGEMDMEGLEGGDGVSACKDACCTELINCKERAGRNFLTNLSLIGSQLATSLGIVGAGIASIVPGVGTIAGAAMGTSVGGYLGGIIVGNIYNSELYSCSLEYKACVQRMNGK